MMRERRRRHDDVHRPFGGGGARAFPRSEAIPRARLVPMPRRADCAVCGFGEISHAPNGPIDDHTFLPAEVKHD